MTTWCIVLGAGAGSFLFRVSVVALIGRIAAPAGIERLAAYVVPAAFAGLAASALRAPLTTAGPDALALGLAVVVTGATAARGRRAPTAFTLGLLTLWATTAVAATIPIGA